MAQVTGLFRPDGVSLGERLLARMGEGRWTSLRGAVAFVKKSGVNQIAPALYAVAEAHPGQVAIAVGLDHGGSSLEGVEDLFLILDAHSCPLYIVKNPRGVASTTFHPKLWQLQDGTDETVVFIGSGNLTAGGLFTNYEASVELVADAASDPAFVADTNAYFARIMDVTRKDVLLVTQPSLQELHDTGDLPSEAEIRRYNKASGSMRGAARPGKAPASTKLFGGVDPPVAPIAPPGPPLTRVTIKRAASTFGPSGSASVTTGAAPAPAYSPVPLHGVFYGHLKHANTTEIYLFKKALDEDPAFWGAPFRGVTSPKRASSVPQPQPEPLPLVSITVFDSSGSILHQVSDHPLKWWTYTNGPSANSDFRVTFPAPFLPDIEDMSVLVITRNPPAYPGLEFTLEVFPPGHSGYGALNAKCIEVVPNSPRRYGWS